MRGRKKKNYETKNRRLTSKNPYHSCFLCINLEAAVIPGETERQQVLVRPPIGFICSRSSIHTSITAALPTVQGGRLNKLVTARLWGHVGVSGITSRVITSESQRERERKESASERRSPPSLLVALDHRPSSVSG